MMERFKTAAKASSALQRKTTEVLAEDLVALDALNRSRMEEPALIMVQGDLPGEVFRLQPGRQLIGRRPECEIRVRERAVSGIHAEVVRGQAGVTINDLASTNGTMVNGMPIKSPAVLTQGCLVKLGNCVFKYVESLLDVEFLESLHARGITDQLTLTFNQSYLVARLAFTIDSAAPERPVAVIAFDFDDFKQVNDSFGHPAGDHVLRASCQLIRETISSADQLFARMGGEEFVIILPGTRLEEARDVAERIRVVLQDHPFQYNQQDIRLTASFGVCTTTAATDQPEAVLERADALLYRSKREGRNRVSAG